MQNFSNYSKGFEKAAECLFKKRIKNLADLDRRKREIAQKFGIGTPSNADLLKAYHNLTRVKRIKIDKNLEIFLRKRKIRSLSGIVIVSVLTKPYPCPGNCLYCPSEKGIPKSYLAKEPAVMRAVLNKFDPYLQVQNRIMALEANGHPTDKIDLRIIGGTWSFYPRKYQEQFITQCFRAANEYRSSKLKVQNSKPCLPDRQAQPKTQNLLKIQKKNEKAGHRIIGITVETRPDYIDKKEIKWLRELGATRVELGVQSIYDDVLELNNRGHKVSETIRATKLLKDNGFKVCFQMMPNLPGSTVSRDKKMFKEIFANPDFSPDMIKIYPCAVLKQAPLYKLWKSGKYKPYTEKELFNLVKFIKQNTPYYVRIQRIIRDIPSENIPAGPAKISNMRQIIESGKKKEGWRCKCIRCREVKENYIPNEKLYLFRQDYKSSDGQEIFLSYESKNRDRLYSLLRLRIPKTYPAENANQSERIFPVLYGAGIIREVHTYGQMLGISSKGAAPQHKGLGKKLMAEAERITRHEFGLKKIAVISGIGVRGYYKKLGYRLKDTYMVKTV